jgi:hypothetical protein
MCIEIVEGLLEAAGLQLGSRRIDVAHLADYLRRLVDADGLADGGLSFHQVLERGVLLNVGAGRPLPLSPKAAHAMAHVQKKRFSLLFTIIGDVDAAFDLLGHDGTNCTFGRSRKLDWIDLLASPASGVEADEMRRPWQTASVRGQNPVSADDHSFSSLRNPISKQPVSRRTSFNCAALSSHPSPGS